MSEPKGLDLLAGANPVARSAPATQEGQEYADGRRSADAVTNVSARPGNPTHPPALAWSVAAWRAVVAPGQLGGAEELIARPRRAPARPERVLAMHEKIYKNDPITTVQSSLKSTHVLVASRPPGHMARTRIST